jgi:hypothetical protein
MLDTFASRRLRRSQERVRSPTRRLGRTAKPFRPGIPADDLEPLRAAAAAVFGPLMALNGEHDFEEREAPPRGAVEHAREAVAVPHRSRMHHWDAGRERDLALPRPMPITAVCVSGAGRTPRTGVGTERS